MKQIKINKSLMLFALLWLSITTNAIGLSGTYTIGTSGADYNSFNAAVTALTTNGLSGSVVFKVMDGTYNEQITIPYIASAYSSRTITFESQSGNAANVVLESASSYALQLDGTRYCSILNITVKALNGRAIVIKNTVDYIYILNNIIYTSTSSASTLTAGIYMYNCSPKHITITNNEIEGGYYGIYLSQLGGNNVLSFTVSNNSVTDFYYTGIYSSYIDRIYINSNAISSRNSSNNIGLKIIGSEYFSTYGNKISMNSTSSSKGIILQSISYTGTFFSHSTSYLHNNFISINGTGSDWTGIYSSNSDYINLYYNTIYLGGGGNYSYGLYCSSGNGIICKNNIFVNTGYGYSIYTNSGSTIQDSDYNNLYSNGTNLAYWAGNKRTLADLPQDNNSININPVFVSSTDLHTLTTELNGAGTSSIGSYFDIDGETRGANPDIGADEFTPLSTMSGTYTIGSSGADFTDFSTALYHLKIRGVNGAVIFNVSPGTYNEQLGISDINGISAANTITFQSSTGINTDVVIQYESTSSNDNYTVLLDDIEYISIKKMTIKALGNFYGNVIEFRNNASYITIDSNVISTSIISTYTSTNGIYINGSISSYNSITNNEIIGGYRGILLSANSSNFSLGNIVSNNNITDFYYGGISCYFNNELLINSNTLANRTTAQNSSIACIFIQSCHGFTSSANVINLTANTNVAKGIDFLGCNGSSSNKNLISNNAISIIGSSLSRNGLYSTNSTYSDFYNNTIYLDANTTNYASNCLASNSDSYVNVKNNVLVNISTGGTAYYISNSSNLDFDYNVLYTSGNILVYDGTANRADLSSLQTASGMESHSISIHPTFYSTTNLHANDLRLQDVGTPLSAVTTDLDGEPRDTKPDIGADEFKVPFDGTYTIGATACDFLNFNTAIDALLINGVEGPVEFLVSSGTYSEQVEIPIINGVSTTNTITFRSSSGVKTDVILGYSSLNSTDNYTLQFNGASHITFKNMTISALGTTYGQAVVFINNSKHIILDGNKIITSTSATTNDFKGLFLNEEEASYISITNNEFIGGKYVIYMNGYNTSPYPSNIQISNNTFSNYYYTGIYCKYLSNAIIENNEITTVSSSAICIGIYFYSINEFSISANKINLTTTATPHGIYIFNSIGTSINPNIIINNCITIDGTPNSNVWRGLRLNTCNFVHTYNNTISLTNSGVTSACYYSANCSNNEVVNNVFINNSTGNAYYVSSPSEIVRSDYNNYFTNGTNLAYWGGTKTSLSVLQTASSMDMHSISTNPVFVSTTDLSPDTTDNSCWALNGTGTQILGINTDINGNARSETVAAGPVDMGAVEFTPAQATLPTICTPINSIADGVTTIYYNGSKKVAEITWHANGGTLPNSVSFYSYSGSEPTDVPSNTGTGFIWWKITPDIQPSGGANYDIKLYYNDGQMGSIIQEADIVIAKRENSSSQWIPLIVTGADYDDNFVSSTGLTSFSEFGIFDDSDDESTLPVTFLDFNLSCNKDQVILFWSTSSEINNDRYEIERSYDGIEFNKIGEVKGAGSSNVYLTYTFMDIEPRAEISYYRLKQIDIDGSISYSKIIFTTCKNKSVQNEILRSFINGNNLVVDIHSTQITMIQIYLFDISGKLVIQKQFMASEGMNTFNIETNAISNGVYFIQALLNNTRDYKKLGVVK